MAFEPGEHLGMLVRRVVVDDRVQIQFGRGLLVDDFEELDLLLMPMAARRMIFARSTSRAGVLRPRDHR
jgi:hypothetical protein